MMSGGSRRRLAAAIGAVGVVALGAGAQPAFAQEAGDYAEWTLEGTSGDFSGTMTLPAGFPVASYSSDSRADTAVPTGASNWIPAGAPFGGVYGSSQGMPYLNLRPAADNATSPSTTTYEFSSPPPVAGWGFALGDIDADMIVVSATDADGNPVPAAGLGFEGVFNYCDASPRPSSVCSGGPAAGDPDFDLPVVTVQATSVTLTGNVDDTGGASGWFQPTMPLSSLTFVFTWQSGFPVYHSWFASLNRAISGAVTVDATIGKPDVEVTVADADGNTIATTTTEADGSYSFDGLGPVDGYEVTMTVPDGYDPVGPTKHTVNLTTEDATGINFELIAAPDEPGGDGDGDDGVVEQPGIGPSTTDATPSVQQTGEPMLPKTGMATAVLLLIATALVASGAALLAAGRGRRQSQ